MQNSCLVLCVPSTRATKKAPGWRPPARTSHSSRPLPYLLDICSPWITRVDWLSLPNCKAVSRAGPVWDCRVRRHKHSGHSIYFQVHDTVQQIIPWKHTSATITFHQSPTVQFWFENYTHYDSHNSIT